MILNYLIKCALLINFIFHSLINNDKIQSTNFYNFAINNNESYILSIKNISNLPTIHINLSKTKYYFSNESDIIEIKYYFKLYDENYRIIRPSDIFQFYGLHLFCITHLFENDENIYSFANIYENILFYCIEYIKIKEKSKFGIKIYKINEINEDIDFDEIFFFTEELDNNNLNIFLQNNDKFNMNYLYNTYNDIIYKFNKSNKNAKNLKYSFLQPPLFTYKRNIALVKDKWYFKNIYQNYFCFCLGESCVNLLIINSLDFQSCKYYFYLSIIDKNKYLYPKTHYLLSDFFNENIESADAYPIFKEMINRNLNAHYITVSQSIYNEFCFNNKNCVEKMQIIFGLRKITGDTLEKYIELILRLKVVIAAEKFESIDNIFYNIDYITYIFLGHGVTYIKSFLYNDYLSPKQYNKILLPKTKRFIDLALKAGWKIENIIKIGYPKWDQYKIYNEKENYKSGERSIFIMFTWRKAKKRKNISNLYFTNILKILYNREINKQLKKNNVKLFFCYHHALKVKLRIIKRKNIRLIEQNEISKLIKNSSLIITDFSSILFDAIVQKKPLILYIPDGLETNLRDIYIKEYYETIMKIKNGEINLFEVFLDVKEVINKIMYYIKNDFVLEESKLKFYNEFRLKNKDNTRKLIKYIRMIK